MIFPMPVEPTVGISGRILLSMEFRTGIWRYIVSRLVQCRQKGKVGSQRSAESGRSDLRQA